MASGIVNEIVGVPANHFTYTHNFAILLLLPAWGLAISAIGLMIAQLVLPFYILLSLLLKPLGITLFSLTGNSHYKITTMIARFILSFVLLYHLILLIGNVEQRVESALSDVDVIRVHPKNDNTTQPAIDETTQIAAPSPFIQQEQAIEETYSWVRKTYQQTIRQLIADFAFTFEVDNHSRCEKTPTANVIELNDYEILEVIPDKNAQYHYRFEVRKCVSAAFPR